MNGRIVEAGHRCARAKKLDVNRFINQGFSISNSLIMGFQLVWMELVDMQQKISRDFEWPIPRVSTEPAWFRSSFFFPRDEQCVILRTDMRYDINQNYKYSYCNKFGLNLFVFC